MLKGKTVLLGVTGGIAAYKAAALASALFFSVVHGSLTQFIPLTLFALIQCWAYERARSLWLPILLHMLFNGISCLYIIFFMNHG